MAEVSGSLIRLFLRGSSAACTRTGDLTWAILLAFAAGFLSICATVLSVFDMARFETSSGTEPGESRIDRTVGRRYRERSRSYSFSAHR